MLRNEASEIDSVLECVSLLFHVAFTQQHMVLRHRGNSTLIIFTATLRKAPYASVTFT